MKKSLLLLILLMIIIPQVLADTSSIPVNSNSLQICSSGELRSNQNPDRVEQCQDNKWITVQDCSVTNQKVWISNKDGIPKCVDSIPNDINFFVVGLIILIIILIIIIVRKIRKK